VLAGSIMANLMFALKAVTFSTKDRSAGHLWLSEVVAIAGLIVLSSRWSSPAVPRWFLPRWVPTSMRRTGSPRPPASRTGRLGRGFRLQ